MTWWKLLVSALVLGGAFSSPVRGDDMDLSLGRLRIAAKFPECARSSGFCPDNELFERLVSELALALAPPVSTPAHTAGLKGISVGLMHSVTTIQGGALYWRRGTEGDAAAAEQEYNPNPARALHWSRLQLRKGLPFGIELAGHVGHGFDTSMWAVGGQLKLALAEGFRSGWGQAPDVALAVGTQALVGTPDLTLFVHSFKLVFSKPYVVAAGIRLTPLLSSELIAITADSAFLDFDWDPCRAEGVCAAEDPAAGFARFERLRQWRLRWSLGFELSVSEARVLVVVAGEVPRMRLDSGASAYGGERAEAQIALTAGLAWDF